MQENFLGYFCENLKDSTAFVILFSLFIDLQL